MKTCTTLALALFCFFTAGAQQPIKYPNWYVSIHAGGLFFPSGGLGSLSASTGVQINQWAGFGASIATEGSSSTATTTHSKSAGLDYRMLLLENHVVLTMGSGLVFDRSYSTDCVCDYRPLPGKYFYYKFGIEGRFLRFLSFGPWITLQQGTDFEVWQMGNSTEWEFSYVAKVYGGVYGFFLGLNFH